MRYRHRLAPSPDRLQAASNELSTRLASARSAALAASDDHQAAMLRGKAKAYREAVVIVEALIHERSFRERSKGACIFCQATRTHQPNCQLYSLNT